MTYFPEMRVGDIGEASILRVYVCMCEGDCIVQVGSERYTPPLEAIPLGGVDWFLCCSDVSRVSQPLRCADDVQVPGAIGRGGRGWRRTAASERPLRDDLLLGTFQIVGRVWRH